MNRAPKFRAGVLVFALSGALGMALATGSALAQALPTPAGQEVLVKTTLLTFNDANLTGNYSVLNAKLSKPFRDQFDADKLKTAFKDFVDKRVDMGVIVVKAAIPAGEAKIDNNGVLLLAGHFDTTPKKIKYDLKFIRSEGEWKPVGIHVDID
jgi:hypothetical protein